MELSDLEQRRIALEKAIKKFGGGVSIGRDYQRSDSSYTVKKRILDEIVLYGEGNSWDEAIENAKPPTKKSR